MLIQSIWALLRRINTWTAKQIGLTPLDANGFIASIEPNPAEDTLSEPFNFSAGTFDVNGTLSQQNFVVEWGHNIAAGGSLVDPAKPGIRDAWEQCYENFPGNAAMERHMAFVPVGGGAERRFFSFIAYWDDTWIEGSSANSKWSWFDRTGVNQYLVHLPTTTTAEVFVNSGTQLKKTANNEIWLYQLNAAGTGYIEIARVNASDKIILGPMTTVTAGLTSDATGGNIIINANTAQGPNALTLNNELGSGLFTISKTGAVTFGAFDHNVSNGSTFIFQGGSGTQRIRVANQVFAQSAGNTIGWSSTTQAFDTQVVGIRRGANRVLAATDGTTGGGSSGTGGWFRSDAGLSRVNADITNATTTLAAVTGLSFTSISGQKYAGRIRLYVEEATAGDGLKLDLDGGTGTWTSFRATYIVYDTTTPGPLASGSVTAIATDFTVATVTGAAWVDIEFSGVANAAGTFIPRQAKNSVGAGANLTTRANSTMQVEDIP